MSQQFCLKWNSHMTNMMDVFKNLLSTESMVDCTLACDGLSLKAHKMVLSACSPFFQALFLENPCKHPIVILKDMKYTELKAIIEFMYHGEVNVGQDQLSALMKTAETLRVKGLAEVTNEKNSQSGASGDEPSHRSVPRTETPPPSKRRRGRTRKRSLSDSNRSDDESNEPKVKQPMSPDIEELSGDHTMEATSGHFSSIQSQVPMQQMPSHSTNSFQRTNVSQESPHVEEPTSADESEFGVEPAKLLEQTLTTDDLANARRGRSSAQSGMEMQRRARSTDHSSSLVPTSMPSDSYSSSMNQQLESPPDIKPELLDLDPPISPVPGPSHSADNSMMFDQSSVSSHPGTSFQDNSGALVPQDSSPQDLAFAVVKFVKENDVAVVPIGWLSNGKCFWPPKKLQGNVLPLKRKPTASQTWEKHRVKILGFYATYRDARSKLFSVVHEKGLDSRLIEQLSPASAYSSLEDSDLEDFLSQRNPVVVNVKSSRGNKDFRPTCSEIQDADLSLRGRIEKSACMSQISRKGTTVSSIERKTSTPKVLKGSQIVSRELCVKEEASETVLKSSSIQMVPLNQSNMYNTSNEESYIKLATLMPLKNDEDLNKLEMRLSDEGTMQQMIELLRRVGGNTANQLVRFMLKKIMINNYARTFSFLGVRGKKPFKGLMVYHAILSAVRTNYQRIQISERDTEKIIGNWLRHAKDRNLGKTI